MVRVGYWEVPREIVGAIVLTPIRTMSFPPLVFVFHLVVHQILDHRCRMLQWSVKCFWLWSLPYLYWNWCLDSEILDLSWRPFEICTSDELVRPFSTKWSSPDILCLVHWCNRLSGSYLGSPVHAWVCSDILAIVHIRTLTSRYMSRACKC